MSKQRPHYLTKSQQVFLTDWGTQVMRLFKGAFPLHVGSSLVRKGWFDVDVRLVLDNDDYVSLASVIDLESLDAVVSQWGQQVTGLPIDFQVQSMQESSTEFREKPRNGMTR